MLNSIGLLLESFEHARDVGWMGGSYFLLIGLQWGPCADCVVGFIVHSHSCLVSCMDFIHRF